MALVLSYRWRRNPERLLGAWGMGSRVRTAREERRFLDALDNAPDNELGNFCLVMGGFTDALPTPCAASSPRCSERISISSTASTMKFPPPAASCAATEDCRAASFS